MNKLRVACIAGVVSMGLVFQTYAQTISTVAGTGVFGLGASGSAATACTIEYPGGVATDNAGNFYFSSRSQIRKVDAAGIVTTVAGGGAGTTDGISATAAAISNAENIYVDAKGVLYFADKGNRTIKKVDTTGLIYKVAGGGTQTADGVPADSFQLFAIYGVVADTKGNVYFSDATQEKIFKVDPAGIIHTYAGYGIAGWTGDGPATSAALNKPQGMAIDANDNIFFADSYNQRIRRIDTNGNMTTVVGSGYTGFTGDGGDALSAALDTPDCAAVTTGGEIYFGDSRGNRIRFVDASGIVTTVTGNGVQGYAGDGGPATAGRIALVSGMAVNGSGELLFSDYANYRIRQVTAPLRIAQPDATKYSFVCYPNPVANKLTLLLSTPGNHKFTYQIVSLSGQAVLGGTVSPDQLQQLDMEHFSAGMYFVLLYDDKKLVGMQKIWKE